MAEAANLSRDRCKWSLVRATTFDEIVAGSRRLQTSSHFAFRETAGILSDMGMFQQLSEVSTD